MGLFLLGESLPLMATRVVDRTHQMGLVRGGSRRGLPQFLRGGATTCLVPWALFSPVRPLVLGRLISSDLFWPTLLVVPHPPPSLSDLPHMFVSLSAHWVSPE